MAADPTGAIPFDQRTISRKRDISPYSRFVDPDGAPQLLDCFVLSLDLLGTRKESGKQAAEQLAITERALSRAQRATGTGNQASGSIVRWFTDNVAIAEINHGYDSLMFGFNLMTVGSLQAELAVDGRFARGGLALAGFFANETLLYGPALIEAHAIEEKVAVYPRIVLSDAVVHFAKSQLERFRGGAMEVHRTHLAVDGDGTVFINYLETLWENEPQEAAPALEAHRDIICERLDEHAGNLAVRQKYEWLANYHDRFCRSNAWARSLQTGRHPGREDKLVPFGFDVPVPEEPSEQNGSGLEF